MVTTIDSYQGQYNDYVLVSLVRTTKLGYLADIRRRLISAMSRAKLGLYVFYRKELFQDCIELSPLFRELPSNSKLQLVKHESFYTHRSSNDSISAENILEIDDVTAMGLKVYEMTLEASKK